MKKVFYSFISVSILTCCTDSKTDFLEKSEFEQMLSSSEYKVLDTIGLDKSEIFEVYQDQGALGGWKFHLLHKIGSSKYHYISYPDTANKIKRLEEKLD
jgi:hypothetical protein